jgi:hypothetical protein
VVQLLNLLLLQFGEVFRDVVSYKGRQGISTLSFLSNSSVYNEESANSCR